MKSIPKTKLEAILEALLYKSQDKYINIYICMKVFMCVQMYANLYIHIHTYAYMNIEKSKNKKGHTHDINMHCLGWDKSCLRTGGDEEEERGRNKQYL